MIRLCCALLLVSLALGCAPPADVSGNVLIWARGSESSTLDPAEIMNGEDAKIAQNIFETLVAFKNHSVELEGRLAESWKTSADGRTRKRWSRGRPGLRGTDSCVADRPYFLH